MNLTAVSTLESNTTKDTTKELYHEHYSESSILYLMESLIKCNHSFAKISTLESITYCTSPLFLYALAKFHGLSLHCKETSYNVIDCANDYPILNISSFDMLRATKTKRSI